MWFCHYSLDVIRFPHLINDMIQIYMTQGVLNHLSQCDWLVIEMVHKLYDQLKYKWRSMLDQSLFIFLSFQFIMPPKKNTKLFRKTSAPLTNLTKNLPLQQQQSYSSTQHESSVNK